MERSELFQYTTPTRGDAQEHVAAVSGVRTLLHEPLLFRAMHELDRAVMDDLQSLGENADGWLGVWREPTDCQ